MRKYTFVHVTYVRTTPDAMSKVISNSKSWRETGTIVPHAP